MPTNGHKNGVQNTPTLIAEPKKLMPDFVRELPAKKAAPDQTDTRAARYPPQLLTTRQQGSFEQQIVPEAQLSDLDWAVANRFLADQGDGAPPSSAEEALLNRGCLAKDQTGQLYLTHAGLLLFGRSPDRFIPSAEIIAACYSGLQMSDTHTRADIRGPLPNQIKQAEVFLQKHIRPRLRLNDLEWDETPALPLDAVREVIINAVAHRDYGRGGEGARLLIFADRLECYSPGRLPGHVTPNNLLTERFSRNEVLSRVLSEMGWVERLGYGLDRVARHMAEEGLPPPQFEETAAGFKVTLFSRPANTLSRHADEGRQNKADHGAPATQRWLALGLYGRQIKAMNFVLEHHRLSLSEYGRLYPDVPPAILRRDLDSLVQRNLLLRVSEGPVNYYILK